MGRNLYLCREDFQQFRNNLVTLLHTFCIEVTLSSCKDDPNGAISPTSGRTFSCSQLGYCSNDWFNAACNKTCGKCISSKNNLNAIVMNSC